MPKEDARFPFPSLSLSSFATIKLNEALFAGRIWGGFPLISASTALTLHSGPCGSYVFAHRRVYTVGEDERPENSDNGD